MIDAGIQSKLKRIGETGCYALCILKLAEQHGSAWNLNAYEEIQKAIEAGYLQQDCYVMLPEKWFYSLTGKRVTVTKAYEKPSCANVECWDNAHFRLDGWDPLENYKGGKITSWRVFDVS